MAKLGFRALNPASPCATPRQMPIRAQNGPIRAQKGPIGAQKGPILCLCLFEYLLTTDGSLRVTCGRSEGNPKLFLRGFRAIT